MALTSLKSNRKMAWSYGKGSSLWWWVEDSGTFLKGRKPRKYSLISGTEVRFDRLSTLPACFKSTGETRKPKEVILSQKTKLT